LEMARNKLENAVLKGSETKKKIGKKEDLGEGR